MTPAERAMLLDVAKGSTMTSRDRIKAIAEIIAPNPHFREQRRIRNGWPTNDRAIADQAAIRTAWRKAEAIDAAVYGKSEKEGAA